MQQGYGTPEYQALNRLEELRQKKETKKKKAQFLLIVFLLLFVITVVVVRWGLYKVKKIVVSGLDEISWQETVDSAANGGLKIGVNLASVNKEKVKTAINANYHLIFEDLILDYRNRTALLVVKERKQLSVIEYLGTLYSISSDGYVMEKYTNDSLTVPKVTGLYRSSAIPIPGQKLINASEKLKTLEVLLYELENQKLLENVSEIHFDDSGEITLSMKSTQTVILGDDSQIMKKLISFRTAYDALWRISVRGGETIDVTNPELVRIHYPN